MLLRKTTWFWKSGLAAISFVLILSISGCSDAPPEENTVSETVIDVQAIQEESEEDADEIISVCIDLYEKAEEISNLVPEAKVVYAHGQMTGHEIENIMEEFIEGKTNVLVCTTILESGIDIPNANTIIVENADRMGLAQLYQIRGRVGNSEKYLNIYQIIFLIVLTITLHVLYLVGYLYLLLRYSRSSNLL